MSTTEHEQATSILHHLFTASSFVGIDFGSGPNHHLLYFSRQGLESWISIEGPWHVHATQNTFDEGEQLEQLMRLRRERIHQVRLGDEHPHLELEFESGSFSSSMDIKNTLSAGKQGTRDHLVETPICWSRCHKGSSQSLRMETTNEHLDGNYLVYVDCWGH